MRLTRALLVSLMTTVMILGVIQSASARSKEIPGGQGPIVTVPTARGTMVPGVLAIYYQKLCTCPGCCAEEVGPMVSMTFFMRLEVGKQLYPFGSTAREVCWSDFGAQQTAIQTYVKQYVIPYLYQVGLVARPDACFAVKEATKVVEPMDFSFDDPTKPVYTLLDFVLAIDDRLSCP